MIADQINDQQTRRRAYEHHKQQLAKLGTEISIEYSPFRWHTLLDHAEVNTNRTIAYVFRDGRTVALNALAHWDRPATQSPDQWAGRQ